MESTKNEIFVIGHMNPDTDSICSAISYAELKKKVTGENYKAKRAGQVNAETSYVLERFGIHAPSYLPDVRVQVKDIFIRPVDKVKSDISLKAAYEIMGKNNVVTLPIVDDKDQLEGLITIGDIAKAYIEGYDSKILSIASTPYANIINTLDGQLLTGDKKAIVNEGKVLVAAANPDLMESYIEEGDIVIVGNRYESQLCAIEMNAKCIIVSDGAAISSTIIKLAESKNCYVISTPYDTFTVARLINQSMPVSHFMTKKDLITFTREDFIEEIRGIMAKKRHRDFPVLGKNGEFIGMISRRSLLDAKKKKLILVDHNERSQAVDGLEDAEILEIIDHHRIGSIETVGPVYFRNQPVGCTCTIVYMLYKENNVEIEPHIAGLLCSAILSDTLMFRSPTCTPVDKAAAEDLARIAGINVEEHAKAMFSAGSDLKNKSPEEIFYQDFKKFVAGDITFGVGQLSSMANDELDNIKEKIIPYMKKAFAEHGLNMLYIMLTNILDESTELLCEGEGAKELVLDAFKVEEKEGKVTLKDVVSRKKQLIPVLMSSLQQDNN